MKKCDIFIRLSTPADNERIDFLFRQMLSSVYGTEAPEGYEPGYLDKFYAGDGNVIFVAEEGEAEEKAEKDKKKVVAYISVEYHNEESQPQGGAFAYLDDFCVEDAFRGRGIGTELLKAAEAHAKETGAGFIRLHAEKTNEGAIRLYSRNGYEVEGEDGTRYLMRKEISG